VSILALVTGSLFRDPERREGKNGPFLCATLKHLDGGHAEFVRVLAFDDEARGELGALAKGDALSVTGRLETELFEKEGHPPRVSLTIFADRILPLKKSPRDTGAPTASTIGKNNGLLRRY
jgi:single-stranded DNA-binding protein